jgi:hypothetical protein
LIVSAQKERTVKITIRRKYIGQQVITSRSSEMGQQFGRARVTPQEAATRRSLSRWSAAQRSTAFHELDMTAPRLMPNLRRRSVAADLSNNW